MTHDAHDHEEGATRRKVLECMTWAGTGILWTLAGGIPRSTGLIGEAKADRIEGVQLPPAQRQPYRLRQAREP